MVCVVCGIEGFAAFVVSNSGLTLSLYMPLVVMASYKVLPIGVSTGQALTCLGDGSSDCGGRLTFRPSPSCPVVPQPFP